MAIAKKNKNNFLRQHEINAEIIPLPELQHNILLSYQALLPKILMI